MGIKLLKQEDKNTRVVQGRGPFGSIVIMRQRRKWWGWERTNYAYTHQCKTIEEYIQHFNWQDNRVKIGEKEQF